MAATDGLQVANAGSHFGSAVTNRKRMSNRMGAERIMAMSRHDTRQKLTREFWATDIVAERGNEGFQRMPQVVSTASYRAGDLRDVTPAGNFFDSGNFET